MNASRAATIFACALLQAVHGEPAAFFDKHCTSCHDAETKKGGLDLTSLKRDFADAENFARWVKVHDRIESGEMPPKKKPRPDAGELKSVLASLSTELIAAERTRLDLRRRTGVRRLTRGEYENTVRDLFDMPGIALQGGLPVDGMAHGFDKNCDALDISHVNLSKYIEAAEHTLNLATATQPQAPTVQKTRISLANPGGFVGHVLMNGDAVMLRNKQPDPEFPAAGDVAHIGLGTHAQLGMINTERSVGMFRHEDESVSPYFKEHIPI